MSIEERLNKLEETVTQLVQHQVELSALSAQQEKELDELTEAQEEEIDKLEDTLESQIDRLETRHDIEQEEVRDKHVQQLEQLQKKYPLVGPSPKQRLQNKIVQMSSSRGKKKPGRAKH